MATFKSIPETTTVDAKFTGRVCVFLESEEDYQILSIRWFYDQGEWLEFRSSDIGDGGGCAQVVQQVNSIRQSGGVAFGIVDRDAVMKQGKWAVFWETDDQKYRNAMTLGPYIKTLCRWEIENYLIDPEEFENILADSKGQTPRSTQDAIKEIIEHCNCLIPVMATNIFFHENSTRSLEMGFGLDCCNRNKMEQSLAGRIITDSITFKNYITRIESFGENQPPDSKQYLDRLNRMIDGKRVFRRIKHQHGLKDIRFLLARRMKEKDKIESEIIEMINDFKKI